MPYVPTPRLRRHIVSTDIRSQIDGYIMSDLAKLFAEKAVTAPDATLDISSNDFGGVDVTIEEWREENDEEMERRHNLEKHRYEVGRANDLRKLAELKAIYEPKVD